MAFEPPPPLTTRRLCIRPVTAADIDDLLLVNGDEEVTRFLPYATWRSRVDGQAWYERMAALTAAGQTLQCVVVEQGSARVVGACLLFHLNVASGRAELGYVMGRAHWQKGYTYEALSALISYAFEVYSLRRLEAEVDPANLASNRLLAKLGFTREGRLRQRWYARGANYDTNIYGLLRHEWTTAL